VALRTNNPCVLLWPTDICCGIDLIGLCPITSLRFENYLRAIEKLSEVTKDPNLRTGVREAFRRSKRLTELLQNSGSPDRTAIAAVRDGTKENI
jgi:hypothetical protein